MKVLMWEYRTSEFPSGTATGKIVDELNMLGQECWELVLVRDRTVKSQGHDVTRTVYLFKRPCGQRDLRGMI